MSVGVLHVMRAPDLVDIPSAPTNAPTPRPARSRFNPGIHGGRGLFALMVFGFHIVNSGLASPLPSDSWLNIHLLNALKFGVEMFFGVSGFVIVGAIARARSARSFLWDRVTRIYPLLWVTLGVITLGSLVAHRWLPPTAQLAANFLAPPPFLPVEMVNPAAWSLGYEMTFYTLCIACWELRRRGQRWWLPMAVVLGTVLLVFFPRAILMPVGVAIAAGFTAPRWLERLSARPLLPLIAFLLLWRALDLWSQGDIMRMTPGDLGPAAWAARVPFILAAALLGTAALLGIARQRGWLGRVLLSPPLQWLGTISYSFYLWQPVVMGPVKQGLHASGAFALVGQAAQPLFAVVALPITLVIAHVSQAWIEVRLTRALRRIGPREGDPHAPLTATAPTTP